MSVKRNTEAIRQLALHKSEQARMRVQKAIGTLLERGQVVNFSTICQEAQVSKTFLYDPKHTDLAEQIRQQRLKAEQAKLVMPATATQPANVDDTAVMRPKTEAARMAQVARLQARISHLEQKLAQTQRENEILYGKLASQPSLKTPAEKVGEVSKVTEQTSPTKQLELGLPAVPPIVPVKPMVATKVPNRKGGVPATQNSLWWVVDREAETYGPFSNQTAQRLSQKLGQGQARIYKAKSLSEVGEQHRKFLVGTTRGSQSW